MRKDFKNIRVFGEIPSLFLSIVLVAFTALILFQISVYIILFTIILQLAYVLVTQRQLVGNSLVVSENQFTDINNITKENAEQFGITIPKVFITQDPYINAYTLGIKKPYAVVLTSALVESLTRDELDYVIGHEMGHIKFGHSRILSLISPIGRDIPFISWLYGSWQRNAEYTADRAGLVLTGKVKPALTAILKMAVGTKLARLVDADEVIKQIGEGNKGLFSKVGELILTHPYATNRIRSLVEYCYFSGCCKLEN